MVWLRENRVYVASRDSSTFELGQVLTFIQRGKQIATGEVTDIFGAELARVRLGSGSLAGVKRLDRLHVYGERASLRMRPALRLGYPSRHRSSLVFTCARTRVISPLSPLAYRTETLAGDSHRLVRDPGTAISAVWPDTLLIHLFDEASDEEIALERGELDVAVFWPGELSAHLREVRHWQGDLLGARSRGVLAATLQESLADSDATVLGRLDLGFVNEQLMHGDLAPWPRVIAAGDAAFRSEASRGTPRVSVDPSLPGHRAFEHLLNQRAKAQAAADRQPSIRLVYLDLPVTPPDSLARRLRELGAMPLFTIRCPVVCTPELRPYVEALGTDALVNMLVCEPAERRP